MKIVIKVVTNGYTYITAETLFILWRFCIFCHKPNKCSWRL